MYSIQWLDDHESRAKSLRLSARLIKRHLFFAVKLTMWTPFSGYSAPARPRLPDGTRIYAVGDIHGRADLLEAVLAQIGVDEALRPTSNTIVTILGDYIDRGPDSRRVIELLLAAADQTFVFLKGNHDAYVENFLKDPSVLETWRLYGGLATLCSYGLTPTINPAAEEQTRLADEFRRVLPDSHRQFLCNLRQSFACGDFLFVHAGIRPNVAISQQKEADLLWIRDEFLRHKKPFEKFVVHGHTPVAEPDIRPNRINIDTGAYASGRLTCLAIDGSEVVALIDARHWLARLATPAQPICQQRAGSLSRAMSSKAVDATGPATEATILSWIADLANHNAALLKQCDPRP